MHASILAAVSLSTVVKSSAACPKCGAIKKSGKRSCCARGGSWFDNCGHESKFDHTWLEGVEACKGKLTAYCIDICEGSSLACLTNTRMPILVAVPPQVPVKPSTPCSKCGTIKTSGKRSCCARGGSWFKICGDAGDSKFDYTWLEGVEACKGLASPLSGDVQQLQIISRHENTQSQLNTTPAPSVPQQKMVDSMSGSVFDVDLVNRKGCDKFSNTTIFIGLLLTVLQMRT